MKHFDTTGVDLNGILQFTLHESLNGSHNCSLSDVFGLIVKLFDLKEEKFYHH